jgi:glycosyltransferase involved in cell wall biosynthesis
VTQAGAVDAGRRRHDRPLRVLHVVPTLDGGGAERVLLTVLHGLPDVTHVVALAAAGTLVPLVPARVRLRSARTELDVAALIVHQRPDVVHAWHDDSLLMTMAPAAQLGVPVVHRIYNVPSIQQRYAPVQPGRRDALARALGAVARIVALSSTAAEDAERFYGIARPQVIYNGFPLAGGRRAVVTPTAPRHDRLVILSVGRLAPEKGHACLIDAFGRLTARADLELWIAGVGPRESDLRRQAVASGVADRVTFLGFREDIGDLLAEADLFAFPSLTEGFGNAVGEALAAGLPIVASDLPVIRHEILGGTSAASLVPPGDVATLAAALDALVSDAAGRAALAERARKAGARFRAERMLAEYRALYTGVADRIAVANVQPQASNSAFQRCPAAPQP